MKHLWFFILIFLQAAIVYSQPILKGKVTDKENKIPIPFVSIGVINKANGTVSNNEGEFELKLSDQITDEDTIRFSSIGYQAVDYAIGDLKKLSGSESLNIKLSRLVKELQPVVINSKRAKVKILGYETNSKLFGLGFGSYAVGSEGGVRLVVKHLNTNLESLSFLIIQNPFDHLMFRVNVYEFKNGLPDKNILSQNIMLNIENKQTGKINFDLSPFNIVVNDDVLISLEWIEAKPNATANLDVAAVLFGSTYIRQASQFNWIKKGAGIGLSVKTSY